MTASGDRAVLQALAARTNYEATGGLVAPTLDRMRRLVDLLGNPERSVPCIHVTGTNGKTTCATAATQVLRACGLRVGTYISPHLESVRERVSYDGAPISEREFGEAYEALEPYLTVADRPGDRITWFEAITALALAWFADRPVDASVLEVGMGGRWDATNVADGAVAAITPIALDHPELGATPSEIAGEKAGIIKHGATVVCGPQEPDALSVIREAAVAQEAGLRLPGDAFSIEERLPAVGGQRLAVRLGGRLYEDVFLAVHGEALATDVVVGAAAAAAFLGDRDLAHDVIERAFTEIRCPGRIEVVARRPLVVLDGAHNPAAATALRRAISESFAFTRLTLVAGMLADKDVEGVLRELAPLADECVVTPAPSARSAPPERLADALRLSGRTVRVTGSVEEAIKAALAAAAEDDCVLVTGSLYTVGLARTYLTLERR